jgi:glycyl-tRNA synthetase beta subunit
MKRKPPEMTTNNLLLELFVEELPPKALKKLGESFAAALAASLKAQGLATGDSVATPYASPRRLAVHVTAGGRQGRRQTGTAKADAGCRRRSMPSVMRHPRC